MWGGVDMVCMGLCVCRLCVCGVYVVWGVCLRMGVCGDSGEYVCGYGSDGHGWCSVCVV